MADQNVAGKAKFTNIKKYYKDTVAELKKVIWPNRQQVTNSTAAVLGSVAVVGAFIWIFDSVLNLLITNLLSNLK